MRGSTRFAMEFLFNIFLKKPEIITPYNKALKLGVFVGMTKVNPASYGGWDGACLGCDLDVKRFKSMSKIKGNLLKNKSATKEAFAGNVQKIASGLCRDDLIVIYYSGHGGQVKDRDGDEADGMDETICLWDGQLTDDKLSDLLSELPSGVRVFMVTDSCHSQTMARGEQKRAESVFAKYKHLQIIHFSGCQDSKSSYGSMFGGELTNALRKTYKRGIGYEEWFKSARKRVSDRQTPCYTEYNVTEEFRNAPAFT